MIKNNKIAIECENYIIDSIIDSKARIKNDDNNKKHVRDFKDGHEFLEEKGKKMIQGEIMQTLAPVFLYCSETLPKDENKSIIKDKIKVKINDLL